MQLGFGSGALYSIKSGSNQTPVRYGVLQNVGIDFKATTKTLFGQYQLPVSVARGSMSISGKGELAQLLARYWNDIFLGPLSSSASGSTLVIDNETGTIPSTPYQITVANSSTFVLDLGVIYSATGLPLTRVSSGPSTGQYSVSAGVYTFAAADTTLGVKISYTYTSASGTTLTMSNQLMGAANTFKTVLSLPYNSQKFTLTLNACVASSNSLNTSLEDFTKQPFAFDAFVDSSDTLGTISFAEAI
jgi:hypothetical protein